MGREHSSSQECAKPVERLFSPEGYMSVLNLLSKTAVHCVTSK